MTFEEEIREIKKAISKVRYRYLDDKKSACEGSIEAIKFLADKSQIIRENFNEFYTGQNVMMYPDEFLFAIQNIPGGNEIILENLDTILQRGYMKRSKMIEGVFDTEGIGDFVAEHFEEIYPKVIFWRAEPRDISFNALKDEIGKKSMFLSHEERYSATKCVVSLLKSKNPAEAIQKYKDFIFTPALAENMPLLVRIFGKNEDVQAVIRDNFEQIKMVTPEEKLPELYQSIKEIYPEEYEKEKFFIEKIYEPALKFAEEKEETRGDIKRMVYSQTLRTSGRIIAQGQTGKIQKLLEEMANGEDIEACGVGAFTTVVKAGDKVARFSTEVVVDNVQNDVPDHPRIAKSIIPRRNISKPEEEPIYVEIRDALDIDTEITDEDLLEVYKDLREKRIKWCDVKKSNLGRRKDGYLVILDTDFIYNLDQVKDPTYAEAPDFIRDFEREYSAEEAKRLATADKTASGEKNENTEKEGTGKLETTSNTAKKAPGEDDDFVTH